VLTVHWRLCEQGFGDSSLCSSVIYSLKKCRKWSTECVPFNWANDCVCWSNEDECLPWSWTIEGCIIKPPVLAFGFCEHGTVITCNTNFQRSKISWKWNSLEVDLVSYKLGLICKFNHLPGLKSLSLGHWQSININKNTRIHCQVMFHITISWPTMGENTKLLKILRAEKKKVHHARLELATSRFKVWYC
jgi:hypothetical protein